LTKVTFCRDFGQLFLLIVCIDLIYREKISKEIDKEGLIMQVKVVELVGESPNNWRDAVQQVVTDASRSIPNISGVEVYNLTANVTNGRLHEYKANVKIAYADDGGNNAL